MRRSYSFLIAGLEPSADPGWRHASPAARGAYYRVCRELVLIAFDRQMAAGLDRQGEDFAPLRPKTIKYRRSAMGPADKHAPPLIPAHSLSRTRSLVDARVEGTFIRVFWRLDPHTATAWGKVLDYHRRGVGRLPIRDVFGLAPAGMASVKKEGLHWWRAFAAGLPVRSPMRPRPGVAAKPVLAILPEYKPRTPAPRPAPSKARQMAFGEHVYTMSVGTSAQLMKAIAEGRTFGYGNRASRAAAKGAR